MKKIDKRNLISLIKLCFRSIDKFMLEIKLYKSVKILKDPKIND